MSAIQFLLTGLTLAQAFDHALHGPRGSRVTRECIKAVIAYAVRAAHEARQGRCEACDFGAARPFYSGLEAAYMKERT